MATTIVKTVKASGGDFTTLHAFSVWLNSQNLVSQDAIIDCQVFISQSGASLTNVSYFRPSNADESRYCIIRPAPGLGVNELEPLTSAIDYGTTGIQLSLNNGDSFRIGPGVRVTGFRLLVATWEGSTINLGAHGYSGTQSIPRLYGNRVNFTSGTKSAIYTGGNGYQSRVTDNLLINTGVAKPLLVGQLSDVFDRNTFIGRGSSGFQMQSEFGNSGSCRNNVFINCGAIPLDRTQAFATTTNNFSNVVISGTSTGFTVNTGTDALIQSLTDARPTPAGPLIAAANSTANSTNDLLGGNRGTAPDVGAIQLNPTLPLPSGEVTTVTVSGQDIVVSGTTSGTVDSATVSLIVAATSNGAIAQGPISVTLGAGTFTATITGLAPGSYSSARVTLTNTGGSVQINSSAIEILGINGNPQAPDGGGGGGSVSTRVFAKVGGAYAAASVFKKAAGTYSTADVLVKSSGSYIP